MSPHQPIIVIVDDTAEDRLACRRYLRQDPDCEYTILEADRGSRALEICRQTQPDCILLDYRLPDMDGLEVLAALAGEDGEVALPVVMLTGADEVSLAVEAMKAGAQDFINKNRLSPIDLRRAVRNAIDRVALRREIREKELRFHTLTEAIPQLVWTCTPDGRCSYLSSSWAEFTGVPVEQHLGYGWFDALHPDDVARTRQAWEEAVTSGSGYEVEFRLRRADGFYRWQLARALPVSDAAGLITNWFGTCTDIEDRRQTEREREQMLRREQRLREQAETANRLKDEFLTVVSHELRTPLHSILGWSKLLCGGRLSGDQSRQAIETIARNADIQKQIIDDLLDVSRIITGKMRLNVSEVSLPNVIHAAIETIRHAAEAKNIQLQIEGNGVMKQSTAGAPQPTLKMMGDFDRLQQVIWNLLSNAIKFTPSGGQVRVAITHLNSQVEILVSDTGKGIKPEFLPYVFDRFRQEDATTQRKEGGLGLGLAIVRQLIELHGGTVRAESGGEGKGATFVATLPLRESGAAVSDAVASPADMDHDEHEDLIGHHTAGRMRGVRILVVDDEQDALELIRIILRGDGAEVRTAQSAADGRQLLDQWRPDVLIVDIGMPQEDGYDFIRQVRGRGIERGSMLPAIALTAYARAEDRVRALSAGYQMHLVKPVEPEELITVITSLIGRKE